MGLGMHDCDILISLKEREEGQLVNITDFSQTSRFWQHESKALDLRSEREASPFPNNKKVNSTNIGYSRIQVTSEDNNNKIKQAKLYKRMTFCRYHLRLCYHILHIFKSLWILPTPTLRRQAFAMSDRKVATRWVSKSLAHTKHLWKTIFIAECCKDSPSLCSACATGPLMVSSALLGDLNQLSLYVSPNFNPNYTLHTCLPYMIQNLPTEVSITTHEYHQQLHWKHYLGTGTFRVSWLYWMFHFPGWHFSRKRCALSTVL